MLKDFFYQFQSRSIGYAQDTLYDRHGLFPEQGGAGAYWPLRETLRDAVGRAVKFERLELMNQKKFVAIFKEL